MSGTELGVVVIGLAIGYWVISFFLGTGSRPRQDGDARADETAAGTPPAPSSGEAPQRRGAQE